MILYEEFVHDRYDNEQSQKHPNTSQEVTLGSSVYAQYKNDEATRDNVIKGLREQLQKIYGDDLINQQCIENVANSLNYNVKARPTIIEFSHALRCLYTNKKFKDISALWKIVREIVDCERDIQILCAKIIAVRDSFNDHLESILEPMQSEYYNQLNNIRLMKKNTEVLYDFLLKQCVEFTEFAKKNKEKLEEIDKTLLITNVETEEFLKEEKNNMESEQEKNKEEIKDEKERLQEWVKQLKQVLLLKSSCINSLEKKAEEMKI
jgi:hypothetical protein